MNSGSTAEATKQASVEPPLPSLRPLTALNDTSAKSDAEKAQMAKQEQQDFKRLKRRVDNLAQAAGLKGKVQVTIRRRGLVIQLLTDKVFFASGDATLKPTATKLIDKIAGVVRDERTHPVVVEGHTDSQPISGTHYPSNWELSGARAGAVVRDFVSNGVLARRVSLAGFASQEPIATNSTPAGREKNRRVEIVLTRIHTTDTES
jgi:chemotaxis protein MotB